MNSAISTVRGSIDRVFFASPTFSAGRLKTHNGDLVSFAGNLFATKGDHVSLAGTWEKHPKYGRQFKVDHVAIDMPQNAEGLAQYLANHPEIKGIGPAKARMLAERFGGDFDRALEEQPEALAEAAHVSLATIATLREHWRKTRNVNAALTRLFAFGLTYHQVSTLVEKRGNNVVAILQDDPHLIIREVRGMGSRRWTKWRANWARPRNACRSFAPGSCTAYRRRSTRATAASSTRTSSTGRTCCSSWIA